MTSTSRLKLALETIIASGKITQESLVHLTEDEIILVQTLFKQGLIEESLGYMEDIDSDKDWRIVKEQLMPAKVKSIPLWQSVMRYAAMTFVFVALGYAIQSKERIAVDNQVVDGNEIKLFLGKDKLKLLSEDISQEITNASGSVIAHHNGNSIKYLNDSGINELVFHEIDVPNGKVFDIQLSDGTIVHLNSGTKMRYPVQFLKGQKREVFIDGEAYFDVMKDKDHLFVVHADAVAIEVLGTKFNISTYKEESEIGAVLVEGSINMTNSYNPDDAIVLKPGTRGVWSKDKHQTKVEQVDVNIYTGWMKGELIFKNSTFENMSKKLERKYNVQIENKNLQLSQKVFNASFSKDIESIEDVLKYMNDVFPFHYEMENNHILIY
ncbi:FecR domain-containing protein [Gelidibacter sp.]|uniref:FecR family protein n=1 Tax=Gelidibacter sp. TaxID=2018083 RepID=UPI0032668A7F